MDPLVQSTLIAGIIGCLTSWSLIIAYMLITQRIRKKPMARIVPRALVDDSDWDPIFGRPVSDWQSKFAWRPVRTIDEDLIWLRRYWRRRIHKKEFLHGGDDFWFQRVVTLRYLSS